MTWEPPHLQLVSEGRVVLGKIVPFTLSFAKCRRVEGSDHLRPIQQMPGTSLYFSEIKLSLTQQFQVFRQGGIHAQLYVTQGLISSLVRRLWDSYVGKNA